MKVLACAAFCLGVLVGSLCGYDRIESIEPGPLKALKTKAEKGDRGAMFDLFRVYHSLPDSDVVRADGDAESLAFFWLQKAADRAHPEAMHEFARYWRYSDAPDREKRYVQWLTKAAEAGYGRAMVELAEAHERTNPGQAVAWHQKAVAIGQPDAFAPLARAFLRGSEVPYDPPRAVALLTQGTTLKSKWDPEGGDKTDAAGCMFELGQLFLEGKHVARDEAAAAKWFQQAGDAGYYMISPRAKLKFAELLMRGAGVPRDVARARAIIAASGASDFEKEPVLAALTEAEKVEAERQQQEREAAQAARLAAEKARAKAALSEKIDRLARTSWGDRRLAPPPELAGLEPAEVNYLMKPKVAPPAGPNLSVDHNKFIPGTKSFSSMRMWLTRDEAEFEKDREPFVARGDWQFSERIRGSDETGGRVMLGWSAWVCLNDWWPDGYGYPNEGAGWCYGAATLDEALRIAYARALQALRTHYQGPIRCIQVEAGISAMPKWDLYRANKTASNVSSLAYSFKMETPSQEKEARKYGFTMDPPEDPEEFPRFARVTMRKRKYPQVIKIPDVAMGPPRYYGSYGLMNVTIPINPRLATTKEQVVADGFPEYFFKEYYFSDEPSPFQVLSGSR